jgi:plastocyanin
MTTLQSALLCVACTLTLSACGGEPRAADSANTTASASTPSATSGESTGVAAPAPNATASSTSNAAAKPATGKTWDVKMIGDATGYKFEPATLTIKQGDAVRWTVASGPPHNVTFWPDSIPQGSASQLQANMPNTMSALSGPLDATVGGTYTISFAGVPAGTYKYYCTPHLAMGMKAQITVQ